MSQNQIALLFGATGLVGKKVLQLLVEDERYTKVVVANRSSKNYSSTKVKRVIIDFENLEEYGDLFQVNHVFVCLGTTIKKAGSQSAFEKVDLEYPHQIAKLVKQAGVKQFVHISAIGANSNSSNFYTKTKGRAEEAIWNDGPKNSYAVRPSMLFGDREEFRLGEKVGIVLMKTFSFLMVGALEKYKGIYDEEVAQAMVFIANSKPKQKAFNSDELKSIATNF